MFSLFQAAGQLALNTVPKGQPPCTLQVHNGPSGPPVFCASTLHAAITDAYHMGITHPAITINGNITATDPEILLTGPLTLQGPTSGPAPTVHVATDTEDSGLLRVMGGREDRRSVHIQGINWLGVGRWGTLLRTAELGNDDHINQTTLENSPAVDLAIDGCRFEGLKTLARGGAVVFVGNLGELSVKNSVFQNTVVEFDTRYQTRWDGGGVLWFVEQVGNAVFENTVFRSNEHRYLHAKGGCVHIMRKERDITFANCEFTNNRGASGAALYVGALMGGTVTVEDSCRFTDNSNSLLPEDIWGNPSGGVFSLQFLYGPSSTVRIGGTYNNNSSPFGRGAVFSSNRLEGTVLDIAGRFTNNWAQAGGVFSVGRWLGKDSRLKVRAGTVSEGYFNGTMVWDNRTEGSEHWVLAARAPLDVFVRLGPEEPGTPPCPKISKRLVVSHAQAKAGIDKACEMVCTPPPAAPEPDSEGMDKSGASERSLA